MGRTLVISENLKIGTVPSFRQKIPPVVNIYELSYLVNQLS